MQKCKICSSVKCKTKCEFCIAFFIFWISICCLTATTDQPTDRSDNCHCQTSEFV